MQTELSTVNPDELDWDPSPTGTPGCFRKMLFRYSQERLGSDGKAAPYTTLYRFDPNSFYPPIRLFDGSIEVWVLKGTLLINNKEIPQGHWVQLLPQHADAFVFGSVLGAELVAITRSAIELPPAK
ncbi:MAG: hypothetical protein MN733_06700 [Nitrososphaera sp.]|nr:hypothetical protein [Nitrososphaera sp.]